MSVPAGGAQAGCGGAVAAIMSSFAQVVASVFLPRKLPTAAAAEGSDGAFVRALAASLGASAGSSTAVSGAHEVFSRWVPLAGRLLSAEDLVIALAALRVGDVLPTYVVAQNAVVTVERVAGDEATVGVFQVSASNAEVTGSPGDLAAVFPSVEVRVPFHRVAGDGEFGRQLAALATSSYPEQYPIAKKHSRRAAVPERRDVRAPTFVTEWLLGATAGCRVAAVGGVQVAKKVRDTVSWADAELPWRRAGEWAAAKAVLHVWFVSRLGVRRGTDAYKGELLALMAGMLECGGGAPALRNKMDAGKERHGSSARDVGLDSELLRHMAAKLARRAAKLRACLDLPGGGDVGSGGVGGGGSGMSPAVSQGHYATVLTRASAAVANVGAVLDARRSASAATHAEAAAVALREGELEFLADTQLQLTTAAPHLKVALAPLSSLTHVSPSVPTCPARVQGAPRAPYFPGFSDMSERDQTVALWDFEAWVTSIWLGEAPLVVGAAATVPEMRQMLVSYLKVGAPFYAADPVGHSSMVLTAYTLLAMMDRAVCVEHPLLEGHDPGVHLGFLTQLLLPCSEQLCQLDKVETYFFRRAHDAQHPALLATANPSACSFSVRFALKDAGMRAVRKEILRQIQADEEAKHKEVACALKEYQKLLASAAALSCSYYMHRQREVHRSCCKKCSLNHRANAMCVSLYERLLPCAEVEQLAVVYDLCVPSSLFHLTDALYLLRRDVCGSSTDNLSLKSTWSKHGALSRWAPSASSLVLLGSNTKPFGRSHYGSGLHPSSQPSSFVVPNGCNTVLCVPSLDCHATWTRPVAQP